MKKVMFRCLATFLTVLIQFSLLRSESNTKPMVFEHGLVLKLPRSTNPVLPADPIEKKLVTGKWQPPRAGEKIFFGPDTLEWAALSANENGWFDDHQLHRSYLYCTFYAEKEQIMLLEQNGNDFVVINGAARPGNRYGYKDDYGEWEPRFNFSLLPVELKKGRNEFIFYNSRTGRLKATLQPTNAVARLNPNDTTVPDFLIGEAIDTYGALVLINMTNQTLIGAKILAQTDSNSAVATDLPAVPPLTVRKLSFRLQGAARDSAGAVPVKISLLNNQQMLLDSTVLQLQAKASNQTHKRTFISQIDGSVQYYAINSASDATSKKALVLSVHGAGVEALNQANSYYPKSWAYIVSPTNRRPYGFNWEDWGRTDAIEVLNLAQQSLPIDPSRVYLTGHSMGGHGTYHLGATFPDRFAAIGPSAGWLSFWSYRVREKIDESSPLQSMLLRAGAPSQTLELAKNYQQLGVYIIHGAEDDNVRAEQSHQMVAHLKTFHQDYIYHEEPGQGHWWDLSDELGADCVDWAPLFDFFARHARPEKERIRQIDFVTANPGISAQNNWVSIEAQIKPLEMSRVSLRIDPGLRRFVGTTENVSRLAFDLAVLPAGAPLQFNLDQQVLADVLWPNTTKIYLEKQNNQWQIIPRPSLNQKGPHRYGTFKDAFNHQFIFVYGTRGSAAENAWAYQKARFDAEQFWYQGNGSIDVLADREFNPLDFPERNIILYGNAQTNSAWPLLLKDSPVQVTRGQVTVGSKRLKGQDLGVLFIRPRPGSDFASIGVVSGAGLSGMNLTNLRPYLSPGYAYPDLIIFSPEMLDGAEAGIKAVGFFGLDWSIDAGEFYWKP